MQFKKLEMLGGIGSILTGCFCTGIGWMDFATGQSWKIWAVMTIVLFVNGLLMIRHSAKRSGDPLMKMHEDALASSPVSSRQTIA